MNTFGHRFFGLRPGANRTAGLTYQDIQRLFEPESPPKNDVDPQAYQARIFETLHHEAKAHTDTASTVEKAHGYITTRTLTTSTLLNEHLTCPPQINLDISAIQFEMDRRRPGQSHLTTPRQESDTVEILSEQKPHTFWSLKAKRSERLSPCWSGIRTRVLQPMNI